MAKSIYGELMDEEADGESPPAGEPQATPEHERSIYGELMDEQEREEAPAKLMQWRAANNTTPPETQAQVLKYSAASGLAPDFVAKNLDQVRRNTDARQVDWLKLSKERPALAEFLLERPQTHPVINDDVAKLSGLEWGVTGKWGVGELDLGSPIPGTVPVKVPYPKLEVPPSWAAAFNDAIAQEKLNYYGAQAYLKAARGLSADPEETEQFNIRAENPPRQIVDPNAPLANRILSHAFLAPFKLGPMLAANVAAAGAGTLAGGPAGAFAAEFAFNTYENLGPAYEVFSSAEGPNGEKLDPKLTRRLALSTALAGGMLYSVGIGPLARSLAKPVVNEAGEVALREILTNPSVQRAVGKAALEFGEHYALGAATMAAQSGVQSLYLQQAEKYSWGRDYRPGEIGAAMRDSFQQGLQDMLLLSAVGPVRGAIPEVGAAARNAFREIGVFHQSAESASRLSDIVSTAKESKLLDRSPEQFEAYVAKAVAQDGGLKTVHIPAEEWSRYWQEKKADPLEIASSVLGDGGKAFREALATKGDLAIPIEKYLSTFAKTEHGEGLLLDAKLYQDALTPRQQGEETQRIAERLTSEAQERGSDIERDKQSVYEIIRDHAIAAGIGKQEADANAKLYAAFAGTAALRMGISVQEAANISGFGRLRLLGPKGEAAAEAARAELQRFTTPGASTFLAERLATLSAEARAREYYLDPISGLRNRRVFDATPTPEGKVVAVITSPDVKGINDHLAGGHDKANELLRVMGKAVGEIDPNAARSGTNFLLHVGSEAELQAAVERVRAALPDARLNVEGGTGKTLDEALTRLDESVGKGRTEGRLPERGKLTEGVDVTKLAFPEGRASATVPESLTQEIGGLSAEQYFKKAYVEEQTGLLTREGWDAIPRKANVASIDLKGLKKVNQALGSAAGDEVLRQFGETAKHFGGSSFDFAHLSGDEYAAQHNDPAQLDAFLSRLREHAQNVVISYTSPEGEPEFARGVDFRHGVGKGSYGEADRDLNRRKAQEGTALRGDNRQDSPRLEGDINRNRGFGDLASGGNPDTGGAPETGGGSAEQAGGPETERGRGATPQHYPGTLEQREVTGGPGGGGGGGHEVVAHIEGLPVTVEGDTSFDFGANVSPEQGALLEEARGLISRMRPDNREMATAWLEYTQGIRDERPPITAEMEKKLARYGIVDPEGYTFDESGRSLERPVTTQKRFGREPEALRQSRFQRLGTDTGYGGKWDQTAFHGSPHRFEKFSLHAMGNGEGQQVFGWGLYFASKKEVAEHYREALSKKSARPGQTYQVEIPETHELLDSEKPLAEQPEVLKQLEASGIIARGASELLRLDRAIDSASDAKERAALNKQFKEAAQALKAQQSTLGAKDWYDIIMRPNGGRRLYEDLSRSLKSEKGASLALNEAGIPGLRYLDAGSHNYVIWNDSRIDVTGTLYQRSEAGMRRGALTFRADPTGRPVSFDLQLFNADKSTFAHESAHFLSWSLHELATSDLGTEQIRKDYSDLLKFAGYDSTEQRLAETREHVELSNKALVSVEDADRIKAIAAKEERISHAWEQYLAEGKPPSAKLAGVFRRFRDWMVRIYRGVSGIQRQYAANYDRELDLTDDVRGIFARMLAVDDAIAEAHNQTASGQRDEAANALMTRSEQEQYRKALAASIAKAESSTNPRVLELLEARNGPERERISQEVVREVDRQPTYRAMRYLQDGEFAGENGEPSDVPETLLDKNDAPYKLSRPDFVARFGVEAARRMPAGVFTRKKTGGVGVDELAPLLGFGSGEELTKALSESTPRQEAIAQRTQERVDQLYGPALKEINEVAMAAVHNEEAAHATLLELRALAKEVNPDVARRVRNLDPAVLRETAARRIAETPVGEVDTARYARAERATALKAAELWGKGEKEAAIEQREARLLNQVFYMEARDRLSELEAAHAKLENTSEATRAELGKADPAYRDTHDAIISALGLGTEKGDPTALEAMLKRMEADVQDIGFDVDGIRQLLSEPKPWDSLTVADALNVTDAITNIRHAASARNKLVLAGKTQERDAWFTELEQHLRERPAQPLEPYSQGARGLKEKLGHLGRGADALLIDVAETYAHMLDVGDRTGPVHRLLIDGRLEARDKANQLAKDVLAKVAEQWEQVPADIRKRQGEEVNVGELLPVPPSHEGRFAPVYTRDNLWMLFLNWGNEGNRQRVRDGNGWSDENVTRALSLLAKPETDFLQSILDSIQSLYPELAAAHERRTGLKLGKVEAKPIELNGQTYAGGYFPLKYDARASRQGEVQEGDVIKSMFAPNYVRPATASSHRKGRVTRVEAPVDLTWGVVPAHVAQVIHDISYGDWVRQAGGIVLDPRFKNLSAQYLGPERAKEFVPWLRDVANSRADSAAGNNSEFLRKVGSFARNRATSVLMAYNIPNVLQGLTDPWLASLEGVGPQHVAAAYLKVGNPSSWKDVPEFAMSKELAYRDAHYLKNLRETLDDAGGRQKGLLGKLTEVGLKLYELTDAHSTRVVFKAAHDKALSQGFSTEEAVGFADDVVRRRFSAHELAEKPPILRSKQGLAALLMFHSYANRNFNSLRRALDDTFVTARSADATPKTRAAAVAELAAKLMAIGAVGVAGSYLAGRGKRDDEDFASWASTRALLEPLNTVPFLGPAIEKFGPAVLGGKTQKVSMRSAPEMALVEDAVNKLADLTQKMQSGSLSAEEKAVLAAQSLIFVAGPGAGQASRTLDYLKQVGTREARPRGPADFASGLIYGQRQNQGTNPLRGAQELLSK